MADIELTNRGDMWSNADIVATVKGNKVYIDGNVGGKEKYSTDETIVGTWIDGRPVYQKVFSFDITSNEIIVEQAFPHDLISVSGMCKLGNTALVPIVGVINSKGSTAITECVTLYRQGSTGNIIFRSVFATGASGAHAWIIAKYVKAETNDD